MNRQSEKWEIDLLDMADVYDDSYTEQMSVIRHEAAFVLSRVAMRHIFGGGEAVHDSDAPIPDGAVLRQPFFFRKRLIEYLYDRGDLSRLGDLYRPEPSLVERALTSESEFFGPAADSLTLAAMKHIESVVGDVLRGRDGLEALEETLGAEQTWRIWEYLMVDAAPKRACNVLVARTLDLRLRAERPIVVFEGGAGVGATLREALLIDGFRERAKYIEAYGHTDISRALLRRAKEMIVERAPELLPSMRFDRVDLDRLDEYDDLTYLQDTSTDLVILESVLHDVENLQRVLTSCRRILKPGGWLVFTIGSRGRPGTFFPCELLQSTLHSYYRAELDPPGRMNVGYLSISEWTASLEASGFSEFRIFPEPANHQRWPYGGIVTRRSLR